MKDVINSSIQKDRDTKSEKINKIRLEGLTLSYLTLSVS